MARTESSVAVIKKEPPRGKARNRRRADVVAVPLVLYGLIKNEAIMQVHRKTIGFSVAMLTALGANIVSADDGITPRPSWAGDKYHPIAGWNKIHENEIKAQHLAL